MLITLLQAVPVIETVSWQYQILMVLLTALSAIITACVPLLVLWIRRRLKLGENLVVQQQVSNAIVAGIRWAEEQAKKAAKGNLPEHSSTAKLDAATSFVLGELERYKLPALAAEQIAKLIESQLSETRPSATPLAIGTPNTPLPLASSQK